MIPIKIFTNFPKKDSNPEFHKLIEDSRKLEATYKSINDKIRELRHIPFFPFGFKKKLIDISIEIADYEKDLGLFIRDKENNDNGALKFYFNPCFDIDESDIDDKTLIILFYTALLKNTFDVMESHRQLLNSNFQIIQSKYENKINFVIALSGWAFTFLGLIVSIIALVGTIFNWCPNLHK